MNTVNPPPQEKGMGCLGKGCLTGVGLVVFLAVAFVGGSYWAVHHLRQTYSAPEPLTLPEVSESELVASEGTIRARTDCTSAGQRPFRHRRWFRCRSDGRPLRRRRIATKTRTSS